MYSKETRSLNDIINNVTVLINSGAITPEFLIECLEEFNDIYRRYFDIEAMEFPMFVETKYFSQIIAAGRLLGFE